MKSLDNSEIKLLQKTLKQKSDKNNISKLRTAIYARKSAKDTKQTSIPAQIAECERFIENYEFLAHTHTFQEDNVSGMFTDKRDEFKKMLSKAENGEIDVIVVMKLDRFSRSVEDASNGIKRLQQAGCYLIAGDIDCMPKTPSDGLLFNIMTAINQYYAQRAASDVMTSECRNAREGFATGIVPYGYKILRANRKDSPTIIVNEKEAPAIRLLFKMIAQGDSYNRVIDELDSQGYKPRKGGKFCKSTLNSMLRNEKYYGTLIYNRVGGKRKKNRVLIEQFDEIRNENAIPPIIDKKLFDRVQTVLQQKAECRPKQNKNTAYILTGFLRCKLCGKPMSGSLTGSKRVRNYICPCHIKKGAEHCDTKDINADKLERAVKTVLTEAINELTAKTAIPQNEIKRHYQSLTQDNTNYGRKITDIDRTIKNLLLRSASTQDNELIEDYQNQVKDCRKEKQRLQAKKTAKEQVVAQLEKMLSTNNTTPAPITTAEIFYNEEISRKVIQLLIDKIYIDNDNIEIQFTF